MRIVEASEMALVADDEIPRHIACIMDGNGRWAQMRGLTRSRGHEAAEESVDAAVDACLALGVQWLTVYAFSTENWKREPVEIQFLMSLHEWLLREEKRQRFRRLGVRLRFVGDLYEMDRQQVERRMDELLRLFDLAEVSDDLIDSYSHGMRQKTALAAALMHDPKVLVLDEPTVGLDPKSARLIKDILIKDE